MARYIPEILLELPKPVHVIMVADHGECFMEQDGVFGHAFVHPKILEVPFTHFILNNTNNVDDIFLQSMVVHNKIR